VIAIGRETEPAAIEQRVQARLTRQAVLTRKSRPLRLWAIVSEAALLCDVGGPEVMRDQMQHLVKVCALPNVTVQVLPFTAGAHLATAGGFSVLSFDGDPDLGYAETPGGELFLEEPAEIARLTAIHDHLKTLSDSPAASAKRMKDRGKEP